jgi:hypothetical protein
VQSQEMSLLKLWNYTKPLNAALCWSQCHLYITLTHFQVPRHPLKPDMRQNDM